MHLTFTIYAYIYGSAEVVGLMCLCVFCEKDLAIYDRLKKSACSLGAAFQKVNFLRDIKSDYYERGRIYFPGVNFDVFDGAAKTAIEQDIQNDFDAAYKGIIRLPKSAKWGVYLAYMYYVSLFNKIKSMPASKVLQERIRVPNNRKLAILIQTYFKHKLNYL